MLPLETTGVFLRKLYDVRTHLLPVAIVPALHLSTAGLMQRLSFEAEAKYLHHLINKEGFKT